ncbi:hypothetical protein MPL3365_170155 [Mesorhizobium plurifarium]|uniref:Uncharacterized protein n=1 Tax=Mesorhizobium plurifarium TaxID=69974 RepID=A0A090G5X0_MESPL|nr:hypothetical protein MPL3365_170155 [Mesorhizobium plurifarium]
MSTSRATGQLAGSFGQECETATSKLLSHLGAQPARLGIPLPPLEMTFVTHRLDVNQSRQSQALIPRQKGFWTVIGLLAVPLWALWPLMAVILSDGLSTVSSQARRIVMRGSHSATSVPQLAPTYAQSVPSLGSARPPNVEP